MSSTGPGSNSLGWQIELRQNATFGERALQNYDLNCSAVPRQPIEGNKLMEMTDKPRDRCAHRVKCLSDLAACRHRSESLPDRARARVWTKSDGLYSCTRRHRSAEVQNR